MKNYLIVILILLLISCKENPINQCLDEPELVLPWIINTTAFEMNTAISEVGNEIYYSISDAYQNYNTIVYVDKGNRSWSVPNVASFSGKYSDFDPFITKSGDQIYFCSRRPTNGTNSQRNDANIWYVEKRNKEWGQPKLLGNKVNSEFDEFYVSLSEQNNLFFSSTRPEGIGAWDIYYFSKQENEVYNVGKPINSEYRDWDPFIDRNEDYIIFASDREGGYGCGDLYVSFKNKNGEWDRPYNLGKLINTPDYEYCPFVSYDDEYLYFSRFGGSSINYLEGVKKSHKDLINQYRSIENGLGNIYRIRLKGLEVFQKKKAEISDSSLQQIKN